MVMIRFLVTTIQVSVKMKKSSQEKPQTIQQQNFHTHIMCSCHVGNTFSVRRNQGGAFQAVKHGQNFHKLKLLLLMS